MSLPRCLYYATIYNSIINSNIQLNRDYVTIYNSINRLWPPPPPRDPRPRGGHNSRHPVPPSGASWSLPRAASITRQYTTQSIFCRLLPRLVTLVRAAGMVVITPFLPPALHGRCRAASVLQHAPGVETPRPLRDLAGMQGRIEFSADRFLQPSPWPQGKSFAPEALYFASESSCHERDNKRYSCPVPGALKARIRLRSNAKIHSD